MITKIRLALALIIMFLVISTLLVFIAKDVKNSSKYKYYITVPNARDYRTNSYTSNGSCITFKNEYNNTVTLCGNYSIIEKK